MWVYRVAKWPPERVAIQPPRVEYSNDCGKWRSVSPAQLLLERGPAGRPGYAPRATGVDLNHAIEPAQVHRHPRASPPRLDAPDHARPTPERDHRRPLGLRPAQHRLDLRLVARRGDQVRRVLELARNPRTTSR